MEDFFGDLFYECSESPDDSTSPAIDAYRHLLRSYNSLLVKTTGWFYNKNLGVLGRWFRRLVSESIVERLTVITFNHDLVMENVLAQLPYGQRWCVENGYGPIELAPVRSRRNIAPLPQHSAACNHETPIELLKLHGSLNWQVKTRSHDPSYKDLFQPSSNTSMDCILDRVPQLALQRRKGTSRPWRLWPQIIPPVYGKQNLISSRFGPIWATAAERLVTAHRLYVVGYSLPPTDVHTEKMLGKSVRHGNINDVVVVNPDPGCAARIAEVTNVNRLRWVKDLPTLLSATAR
jgi:hypothetical protein